MMERVGQIAAQTLVYVGQFVKPGITTNELDLIAYDFTMQKEATPAPLGYRGYPKSICTSVNSCICHGLPGEQVLKEGDIINIDITSIKDGFHGDTSAMFFVGEVSEAAQRICEVAENAMYRGIEEVGPFATTGSIGFAINKYVTKKGYFPVREIGGHGIGRVFHTDPFVPSYGKKGRGDKLRPWTCITVEPMINETDAPIRELSIANSDVKIYETSDGVLSAQYEHTVLVTDQGYAILTERD
ncbi:MAG: type I methionyl aminopeptidase [Pseudobdellovibrionaceae bacterium]|nr:type I methionyl aminopeptidase [Bdellovibrionales bacterium]USN48926.1 MAG: type I methionyl aminopeptidase [Pseudobdellovibrionaceae bacterium]